MAFGSEPSRSSAPTANLARRTEFVSRPRHGDRTDSCRRYNVLRCSITQAYSTGSATISVMTSTGCCMGRNATRWRAPSSQTWRPFRSPFLYVGSAPDPSRSRPRNRCLRAAVRALQNLPAGTRLMPVFEEHLPTARELTTVCCAWGAMLDDTERPFLGEILLAPVVCHAPVLGQRRPA